MLLLLLLLLLPVNSSHLVPVVIHIRSFPENMSVGKKMGGLFSAKALAV